jgi:diguanylate cyclase (GGDEF)-like protein/PAS domain S-box-containing protein
MTPGTPEFDGEACNPPAGGLVTLVRPQPGTTFAVVGALAFAGCLIFGSADFSGDLANYASTAVALLAGVACLARAARLAGRLRLAWGAFGLGSLSYAVGEGTRTWTESIRGQEVPGPGLPDVGHLGMVLLIAVGLLFVPVPRQTIVNRVRSVIDALMIATSLLLISWIFVISPLFAQGSVASPAGSVALAYPVGDIILVTAALSMLALLRRGHPDTASLTLIAAAMLVIGVSGTIFAYAELSVGFIASEVPDIGWYLGFTLVFLGARRGAQQTEAHPAEPAGSRPFAILMPYAVVLSVLVFSIVWFAVHGHGDAFYSWCRSALILIIVARQLLTLLENRQLTATLESRVTTRTAELLASEQRSRALVSQSSDSVAVLEGDSTIRFQSDSVERIFGWPAQTLLGSRLIDIAGPQAGPVIAAALEEAGAEPYAVITVEVPLAHRDGRVRVAEMTITNLLGDPSVGGFVLNTRDVHDAHELQNQLVHEAYHDALTQLASRALFAEHLDEAMRVRPGPEVAVLFLDLDGFKEVNDSLGHAAGDHLLVQVAGRIRESARDGDTVARFGGDEFAVLVRSVVARADTEAVARRIVAAIGRPFIVMGRELHVSASIGIAVASEAADLQQLLRNADLAMYQAKTAGGGGWAGYHPRMHDLLVDRLALEADLRLALDRDEMVLHYQPTVDLRTGEVVGFEALVRWQHPVRGLVSPLDFIPAAEATGMIVQLGRWVLTQACRQAVAWARPVRMAVNVSVRQFDRDDLAETVAAVLAETGLPARRLCLEMTESVLMTDTEENLAQLRRIKALGVTLAMDDFGTGYSSLAYLRRYPMDILKIDRSFVQRLGGDSRDTALVRTIVDLGRSLGMETVAEGIELPQQLAALQTMGCDFAQGFLLSRPVPATEATHLLNAGLSSRLVFA